MLLVLSSCIECRIETWGGHLLVPEASLILPWTYDGQKKPNLALKRQCVCAICANQVSLSLPSGFVCVRVRMTTFSNPQWVYDTMDMRLTV